MKRNNFQFFLFLLTFPFVNNLAAQQLKIAGGYLKINNSSNIMLQDMNLVSDGNLTASDGTVAFTGINTNTIGGTNSPTFDKLTINKASGEVQLEQTITVNNHLELTSGLLDLQDSDANLTTNATIGNASSSTYVQTSNAGTLVQQVIDSDVTFPVGNSHYNPAILNNDGGTSDFYAVRVRDEVLEDGSMGDAVTSYAVNRTWEISEQTADGSNLDITLIWDDADEIGTSGSDYVQANYDGMWTVVASGAAVGTLGLNSLSSTDNSNLGEYAVLEDRSPLTDNYICNENGSLDVTGTIGDLNNYHAQANLTSNAVLKSGANILYTASTEITLSEGFTVANGASFHAFIATCSFNAVQQLAERNTESPVPALTKETLQVEVFPNPFSNSTNIEFYVGQADQIQFFISDLNGRILHSQTTDAHSGWQQTSFEAGNLPSGTYFLYVRSNGQQAVKQLVVAHK
ncbi:MAG: 3-coathanger stack domain-containing protein [Bacteroidota bacterium]